MKYSLESKLLNILSDKDFNKLSDEEKAYVLTSITEDEYSFYKKTLTGEERIEEIIPNKNIKHKLNTVLNNKRKATNRLYKVITAVASVIIIAITIWSIPKNNSNVNILASNEINSDIELYNTKITNVLLQLGRIENQSSKIIPSINYEVENSININSKVFYNNK